MVVVRRSETPLIEDSRAGCRLPQCGVTQAADYDLAGRDDRRHQPDLQPLVTDRQTLRQVADVRYRDRVAGSVELERPVARSGDAGRTGRHVGALDRCA